MGKSKRQPEPEPEPESESEGSDASYDPAEFLDGLPGDIRERVHGLVGIQKQHDAEQSKFAAELSLLEKKYEALYAPLFEKRRDIVQGLVEPTGDEIAAGSKIVEIEDGESKTPAEGPVGIPNFWLTALKNHEMIEERVTPRDEECLAFLKDITAKTFGDATDPESKKGFTLDFFFSENPFFGNAILTKSYTIDDEDEIMLEKAEGCAITWKEGKNLTVVMKKKKQRHKGGKNIRTVTQEEPCESFFNFFSPPDIPEEEGSDEDEMEELEEAIETDFEAGRAIKDKIIPRAIDWFTGEAIPAMNFDMGGGGDGDDSDEDGEAKPKALTADGKECKQQ